MTGGMDARRAVSDALPALAVVAIVSVAMSRSVDELHRRLPVLTIVGVCGVALSLVVLDRITPSSNTLTGERPPHGNLTAGQADLHGAFVSSAVRGFETFSLAKEGAADNENEDSLRVEDSLGLVAVSDGASSSFGARIWSRALVDAASTVPGPIRAGLVGEIVERAAVRWREQHLHGDLEWWAKEGLRRGAFATLLVVSIGEIAGGRGWRAIAVGDSCVFHLRRSSGAWHLVRSFPVETADDFGSHPALLSSVTSPTSGIQVASGELQRGDVLIAATDAISEWMLRDSARIAFVAETPVAEVLETARNARRSNEMVNDDVTFIRFQEEN